MGYDIYTVKADTNQSEKFARKYGYSYLFKPSDGTKLTTDQLLYRTDIPDNYKFDGDSRVYFRANIRGMAEVRKYFQLLLEQMPEHTKQDVGERYINFVDAISWNEGRHVKTQDILMILQLIQYFGQDVGQIPLVEEFIEYMKIASTLDGFHVW